ncbi:MAG TPA: hypothetical protein VGF13_13125, partial [Verrucomicrobiae bacterium]
MPKPRKTKAKSPQRAIVFIGVVALAGLAVFGAWRRNAKHQSSQPNAPSAPVTNGTSGTAQTNIDDRALFVAWVSSHTNGTELLEFGTRFLEE